MNKKNNKNNIYQKIKTSQNPKEFWSQYFAIFFLPFFSTIFIKLKIHPNIITLMMLPLSFLSIFISIFIQNFNLGLIVISIIGISINMIDFVDGAVARYSRKTSIYGKYLDRLCHYVANPAVFMSYGLLALNNNFKFTGLILILITFLDLYDVSSKDNLHMIKLEKKVFSYYSKQKKIKLNLKSLISLVIRIFFSSLTSMPHIIFLLFPLFFYFSKLFSIYIFLYLIITSIKVFFRSKNIYKYYKKNEEY